MSARATEDRCRHRQGPRRLLGCDRCGVMAAAVLATAGNLTHSATYNATYIATYTATYMQPQVILAWLCVPVCMPCVRACVRAVCAGPCRAVPCHAVLDVASWLPPCSQPRVRCDVCCMVRCTVCCVVHCDVCRNVCRNVCCNVCCSVCCNVCCIVRCTVRCALRCMSQCMSRLYVATVWQLLAVIVEVFLLITPISLVVRTDAWSKPTVLKVEYDGETIEALLPPPLNSPAYMWPSADRLTVQWPTASLYSADCLTIQRRPPHCTAPTASLYSADRLAVR